MLSSDRRRILRSGRVVWVCVLAAGTAAAQGGSWTISDVMTDLGTLGGDDR
ncbi:MAG: hypothetical protein PVSMB1_15590 [Gemmatimonadaceae bacterium]